MEVNATVIINGPLIAWGLLIKLMTWTDPII